MDKCKFKYKEGEDKFINWKGYDDCFLRHTLCKKNYNIMLRITIGYISIKKAIIFPKNSEINCCNC